MNFGNNVSDSSFIYCHDQEPLYSDIHKPLFDSVQVRNTNCNFNTGSLHSAIIVSELNSHSVESVCSTYQWVPYYYFFHGWAALDWYRGYNKTFLISDPSDRQIRYSFVSPNRIIGGQRDHRVLLMYLLLKQSTSNALISFPLHCPHEQCSVLDIAKSRRDQYPDIVEVMSNANLPWNMPGETGHPMHSYQLSLFEENFQSLVHVVTETAYFGRKWHLTEKTFKPICLQMPFVLVSNHRSLEYLRRYGFETFGDIWDESYDSEPDDFIRLEKIAVLLKKFDSMSARELNNIHQKCIPIIKHNYQHFYQGGFEHLLWQEFTDMLSTLHSDFHSDKFLF